MNFEAIVIDTETTCVDEPQVLELAWQSHYLDGGEVVAFEERFLPTKAISLGALATHHILETDLEGCADSGFAPARVPTAEYWIGHNVDFDWKALGRPQVKRICTLAMARSIWPKCDSHSLTAMMYYLEGRTEEVRKLVREAHGAAADVGLCAMILRRIADGEGIKTFRDLYGFSEECRIPKIMTFGKFKGMPVSAVDRGWANWYQRQEDTDPYLLTALRKAGKL